MDKRGGGTIAETGTAVAATIPPSGRGSDRSVSPCCLERERLSEVPVEPFHDLSLWILCGILAVYPHQRFCRGATQRFTLTIVRGAG